MTAATHPVRADALRAWPAWVSALLVLGCAGTTPAPAPAVSSSTWSASVTPATVPPMTVPRTAAWPTAASPTAAPPPSLRGDQRNAWAFAPLRCPDQVVVEGSVAGAPAWSTSKVLVAAAFVKVVAGGDPRRLNAGQRRWVASALQRSDGSAVVAMAAAIPGGQAAPINAILRAIGDTSTRAPDRRAGLMRWSLREQVRFLGALAAGRVANRATSRYLLETMRPIRAHAWGLGSIGASAWKGGWLRPSTPTRQMGIVNGYAVALITAGVGPAVRQSDGDWAHVAQLNRLAGMLRQRLTAAGPAELPQTCR
ncbi:MAG: hypothetical protein IPL37_07415 [Austwickia sp.]|nr:hypothetical protein [Austwickia sp.]